MPLIIEKTFTVECCVRCRHVYQIEWDAKIRRELKANHKTRSDAIVQQVCEEAEIQ